MRMAALIVESAEQIAPATSEREVQRDGRPPLWLEQRATLELWELLVSPVYYGVGVPLGDGAPVLLLAGFMGSDAILDVLHGWLRRMDYRPYRLGLPMIA